LDWNAAVIWHDRRRDYGEKRYCALAMREGRLHAVTFTVRMDVFRIISFRKANARERNRYEEEKA
jgi:uncharacterized DUF497 family protein